MANNISVKDASASSVTLKTTDNAGVHTPSQNIDAIIPGTGATNLGKAEDAAHASGDTGVFVMGVRKDSAASTAGTDGDYSALTLDASGQLRIVPEVKPQAATTGGATPYSKISAGGGDAASIKGSAGQLYGIHVSNKGATACYVKLYDSSSAPTVGSGTPKKRIYVPAGATRDLVFPVGVAFALGIGLTIVTDVADAGTTAVAANDVIVEAEYA